MPSLEVVEKLPEVVKILGLNEFIKEYEHDIHEKLKECYYAAVSYPKKDKEKNSIIFITAALKVIDAIIEMGSNQKNYNEAVNHVKEKFLIENNAKLNCIITALVFKYVINRACDKYSKLEDQESSEYNIWKNIGFWARAWF